MKKGIAVGICLLVAGLLSGSFLLVGLLLAGCAFACLFLEFGEGKVGECHICGTEREVGSLCCPNCLDDDDFYLGFLRDKKDGQNKRKG